MDCCWIWATRASLIRVWCAASVGLDQAAKMVNDGAIETDRNLDLARFGRNHRPSFGGGKIDIAIRFSGGFFHIRFFTPCSRRLVLALAVSQTIFIVLTIKCMDNRLPLSIEPEGERLRYPAVPCPARDAIKTPHRVPDRPSIRLTSVSPIYYIKSMSSLKHLSLSLLSLLTRLSARA